MSDSEFVKDISDSSFEADVLQSDRPVLVDFWAEWCAPCRMLAPTVAQVAEKYAQNARVVKLNVDNNPVENSLRGVAIGRKNYMFAGSHAAAQRAAMFYSLLVTCKNYGINPYAWLHDVLNRIATHPINRINELLPQNWKPQTTT